MSEEITEEEKNFLKRRRIENELTIQKLAEEEKIRKEKKKAYPQIYNKFTERENYLYKMREEFKLKEKELELEIKNLKKELVHNCRHYQPINQTRISFYDGVSFECPGCKSFLDSYNHKIENGKYIFLDKNGPLKTVKLDSFDSDSEDD